MLVKGVLIVISGPSGTGKGTICKELMSRKLPNLELSVSVTTRKPRDGEIEGINYFFKDKAEFNNMIINDDFIEYAKVYDNYYGTPKKYVFDKINEGNDIILEIDTQGALNIKKKFNECILVFVMPPSLQELRKRITGRGTDTEADINKRLKCAHDEMLLSDNYDYIIVNDDIISAADKVQSIISAEKCRACRFDISNLNNEEEI